MKRVLLLCLLICMVFTIFAVPYTSSAANTESHVVMAYNINGAVATTNEVGVMSVIKAYDPDLIALNEVNYNTSAKLIPLLESAGYAYYGTTDWSPHSLEEAVGRAGWRNYVCYKTSKYSLIESGTFSLSDSPTDPHAFISIMPQNERVGEGTEGRPRNCNWAYLTSKNTHDRFIFSSAHVQWLSGSKGDYNKLGLGYLAEQLLALKAKYNCDILCGGDMNANTDSTNIAEQIVAKGFSKVTPSDAVTYGWRSSIDNVFYSSGFSASGFKVGTEYSHSDHKPICVTMTKKSIDKRYKMELIANQGGKSELDVEGESTVYMRANETVKFKLIPEKGYAVSSIKLNGESIAVKNNGDEYEYQFKMPAKDCKLEVAYSAITYKVTTGILSGKGTVSVGAEGKTECTASVGEKLKIYVTPADGFLVTIVKANAKKLTIQNDGKAAVYSYDMIAKDSKISVTFERDPNYVPTATPSVLPSSSATATSGVVATDNIETATSEPSESAVSTQSPEVTEQPVADDSNDEDIADGVEENKKDNTLIIVLCCIAGGIIVAAGIFALVFFLVTKKKR